MQTILNDDDHKTLAAMYPGADPREYAAYIDAAEAMVRPTGGWGAQPAAELTYRMAVMAFVDWKMEESRYGFTPRWHAARDSFDCFRRYCARGRL